LAEPTEIDLLVPTVARTFELERLLRSIAERTWEGNVRVLLVDQNPDDRLRPIVEQFGDTVAVIHLRSEPGVSRACNVGFGHSSAAVLGRADDDSWYSPDAFARVVEAFEAHPDWDAICGITCDESGSPTQLRWDSVGGVVTRRNVFRRAIGATLFMRRSIAVALGDWDESYGPRPYPDGTIRGGSEDGEYILRILDRGFTLGYDPAVRIFHADFKPAVRDRESMQKAYFYGVDHSRLLRQYAFPGWYAAWRSAQLVGASVIFLFRGELGRARFYFAMALGRARGLLPLRRPAT
jgi:GT2 family glycosyltransferase